MKKNILTSLLSLIAVFSVCESALGGIKITPTGTSGRTGGISYYTSKGNGTADPHYSANEDLRIYANGTITISSMYGCMRSIVFNISSQGRTRLASITASSGTISEQTSGATTVTWTGNARTVTLTVGDKADYGSGDHSRAGQLCFTDFVVELDGNIRLEGDIIMFADNLVRNECLAKWDKNDDDRLSLNEAAAVKNLGSFWNTLTYSYFTSFDELRFFTGLTSIDANAFLGCKSLTSIIIPENVTSIEIGAFEGCSSLTSITIPKNVTDIERNAFLSCSGLKDVYIYAIDVPTTGTNLFDEDIYRNSTLHVPTFSLAAYRATEPWSKFGNIVADDDYDTPNVTGKTFRLSCARGYVGYNGFTLCGTSQEAASKFAIVDYGNTNYLYDVTNKAFVIHTTAAKAGLTGNLILESSTVLSKAVTGLTWGKTYINDYPYYLEDYFGNWLNMDENLNVCMNTWKDFEEGNGGNTYQVEIVNGNFDTTEAIQMLDSYFNRNVISDLSELSNSKQYFIRTEDEVRGALGVANSELASTNPTAQGHKCEKATPFAILQYDGNYFLYSTADQKFITGTGGETDTPQPDDAWTLVKNENGYFMFKVASTGNVLNVNNSPGIQINTWGQDARYWDDGNQFTIEEAGDFDPTDALYMFFDYNTPCVTGKTFTLRCARGYVGYGFYYDYDTIMLRGEMPGLVSEFAIVDYGNTNYLYDVTNHYFVVYTTAYTTATMGDRTGSFLFESRTDLSKAVTGLRWGETGFSTYPWYLEDSFSNWLNMDGNNYVNMNTWKDFEGGNGGNTYQVEIVKENFDATEAIQMLDRYFYSTFISSITLNKTSEILKAIDQTIQLTPTIEPNNATNKNVVWTSSNRAVATVSNTGLVTSVGSGTATITAMAADGSGVTATCEVTVKIPVTSITLDKTSEMLTEMGQTIQLTPTVLPDNATDKTVTWSSSNPAVATVSETGLVNAVGSGTATITATAADGSGVTASCEVTVKIPVTSITLDTTSEILTAIGQTVQLTPTIVPDNATLRNVTWTSSNESVAVVDENGLVKALGNGIAVITATTVDGTNLSASCTVEVVDNTPHVTGKTFTLRCARGYVGYDGSTLCSTTQEAASEFAIVDYGTTNYLYDVTHKAFVIHSTAAMAGDMGNRSLESSTYFAAAVTGLTWGKTGFETYPWYLEDCFGNWLNMNKAGNVYMNTWQDFEDGDGGNTYQVDIVSTSFDATEAIQMLDNYFQTAVEVTDEQYQAALNSVGTDTQYAIYTLKGRTRYYLTNEGYLTAEPTKDCVLTFARTEGDGLFRSPGWKVDACFTNPHLSENGGASGALLPQGHILTDKQGRDDWEGQVWYLGDNGCYAVRATNAVSDTWGANTYWTVLDTNGDGVPEADYSWAPAFVWQLESDVVSVGIRDIDNGQSREAGAWYTLDGRKLSGKPATKGIFIQNSKKVVVR